MSAEHPVVRSADAATRSPPRRTLVRLAKMLFAYLVVWPTLFVSAYVTSLVTDTLRSLVGLGSAVNDDDEVNPVLADDGHTNRADVEFSNATAPVAEIVYPDHFHATNEDPPIV